MTSNPDERPETALLALLRGEAGARQERSTEIAKSLSAFASRIEDPIQAPAALAELNRYANHHKGLGDLIVPGADEAHWRAFVNNVRSLSLEALRRRGIDASLMGRLNAAIRKLRAAP